jgi:integrase
MPDDLVAALRAHQEIWGGFTREDGTQFNSDGLRWRCEVVFRDAGLGQLDAYCMRHTFASIMDARGVREQTIADLMGHGNVTTFKKIYRHRLHPVVAEAAGIMNDIWGNGAAA